MEWVQNICVPYVTTACSLCKKYKGLQNIYQLNRKVTKWNSKAWYRLGVNNNNNISVKKKGHMPVGIATKLTFNMVHRIFSPSSAYPAYS